MKNGIQIVVLGFNFKSGGKKPFKVLNRISMHGDYSGNKLKNLQTAGVEKIKELYTDFQADYVYVDQGHGSMQAEELSKFFFEQDAIERFKPIDFSSTYEMEDIYTGQVHHKRRKVMMVYFLQKRFELEEIMISEKEESGKNLMIEQLMLYNIVRYDSKDQPIFNGEDHILDALMLAVFAFIENFDSIFDKRTGIFVAGFINNIGRYKDEFNTKPQINEQTKLINKLTNNVPYDNSLSTISGVTTIKRGKRLKRGGYNFDIF